MSATVIAARDINTRHFIDAGYPLPSILTFNLSPFHSLFCVMAIVGDPQFSQHTYIHLHLRTEMEATFGDCKPNITLHLRDHVKSVKTAAGFVIAEGGPNKCVCADEKNNDSSYIPMTGILNDLSSISIGVSPVAAVGRCVVLPPPPPPSESEHYSMN
jgi:hypothetical protein